MLTWFNRVRPELLEPEAQKPAMGDKDLAAHQGLDRALRRSLKPGEVKFNASAFEERLMRRLKEAPPLSFSEKASQLMESLFSSTAASGPSLRFAALVSMPVFALVFYAALRPGSAPELAQAPTGLHEDMAPDAGDLAMEREIAMQMGGGVDDPAAGAAKRAVDLEFNRVAEETAQIQEELLLKNLEMASSSAAKKSALEQLIDFYKTRGQKDRADAREKELKKLAP